jgi:5-methylthioadenosine/S-adenosylhomocysteine deaminase
MIEAMKLASFLGKSWRGDPEAMPCAEVFRMATESGALIAGFGDGRLSVGSLADMSLVDLSLPVFTPNHNFLSNLVFAANGSCIDTVICGGRVLMRHREIAGEFEILEEVRRIARKLKP